MAKHILSCSFGKDSIATALLALQHGEPLDELVYCEVMFSEEISGELPEHNRFIHETAIPYFEQRGIPTRVLRSEKTYLSREDTPTPTPDNTPTPDHTPQPTPNTTPAPTPVPAAPTATPTPLLTIPKTGDNSSLGLLLAIAGISLAGLAVLVYKSARRKDIAPRDDDDEDTED